MGPTQFLGGIVEYRFGGKGVQVNGNSTALELKAGIEEGAVGAV